MSSPRSTKSSMMSTCPCVQQAPHTTFPLQLSLVNCQEQLLGIVHCDVTLNELLRGGGTEKTYLQIPQNRRDAENRTHVGLHLACPLDIVFSSFGFRLFDTNMARSRSSSSSSSDGGSPEITLDALSADTLAALNAHLAVKEAAEVCTTTI